jgi:hypothetical protein
MSWWNPFDNGNNYNDKYKDNLSDAIFNLAPASVKIRKATNVIDEALRLITEQTFAKRKILSEIERLKKDKWDDEGFDRLYDLVDREILEDPKVK